MDKFNARKSSRIIRRNDRLKLVNQKSKASGVAWALKAAFEYDRDSHLGFNQIAQIFNFDLTQTKDFTKLRGRIAMAKRLLEAQGLVVRNKPDVGYRIMPGKADMLNELDKVLARAKGLLYRYGVLNFKANEMYPDMPTDYSVNADQLNRLLGLLSEKSTENECTEDDQIQLVPTIAVADDNTARVSEAEFLRH